jgi:hypothetical protein
MMKSTINARIERVSVLLSRIDVMNDQIRLLMYLIEKEDREEKDVIRYAGILGD